MRYPIPLEKGIFLRRYKRFFADIEWQGKTITAHIPNTGSLKGCLNEGAPCAFSLSPDPNRKLPYTLHLVQDGDSWVGVNTAVTNELVFEAWQKGTFKTWKKFDAGQREVRLHARTRVDLVLWRATNDWPQAVRLKPDQLSKHRFHFVEVKNVTMAHNRVAMFPDAETERGQKHLKELMALHEQGHTSEIFFAVQRGDCQVFAPADSIDPAYGKLLRQAIKVGVKVTAFPCEVNLEGVQIVPLPLMLDI
jgi:sugar fermentation stimulation protein A